MSLLLQRPETVIVRISPTVSGPFFFDALGAAAYP